MRLSVCVPTHHGRCADLEAALERLSAQVAADAPGAVELCVTDNASDDGTEAMVAGLIARGAPVRYLRHPRDLGAAANVMASVALAAGEWCWLHSSDDLVADGALRTVLATIAAHPGALGITVGRATFDVDLVAEGPVEPAVLRPSDPERARTFTDPAEALAELGLLMTYLPSQVVRRDAWAAVVAADPTRPTAVSTYYPHVHVLARMLLTTRAPWVWVPDKLVLNRPRLDLSGVGGSPLAAALGQPADLVRTWTAGFGRRHRPLRGPLGAVHRALLARAAGIWAVPLQLDALKAAPGHTTADDARMLAALVRTFWSLPAFWRDAVPHLLRPHGRPRRRRARRMDALAPADLALAVTAPLPATTHTGRNLVVACDLVNRSAHTLRSAEPHPIRLGARWYDAQGATIRECDRAPLPADLPPGGRCRVALTLPTPWSAGPHVLEVSALQEGVAWCADVDPALGRLGTLTVVAR